MIEILLACVTVLVLAAIAAATVVKVQELRLFAAEEADAPPRVGHRVTVHTKEPDDRTFFGVLIGDYEDRKVLVDAEYVTANGSDPITARQVHLATRDISWIDVHDLVAHGGEVITDPRVGKDA